MRSAGASRSFISGTLPGKSPIGRSSRASATPQDSSVLNPTEPAESFSPPPARGRFHGLGTMDLRRARCGCTGPPQRIRCATSVVVFARACSLSMSVGTTAWVTSQCDVSKHFAPIVSRYSESAAASTSTLPDPAQWRSSPFFLTPDTQYSPLCRHSCRPTNPAPVLCTCSRRLR